VQSAAADTGFVMLCYHDTRLRPGTASK
jgi:hypothetical protein